MRASISWMLLLLVTLGLLFEQSVFPVYAFSNGQNASLVIGQSSFTTNTTMTTQSGLNYPFGISIDPVGNLWVTDTFNYRVLRFSPPFSNGMNADLVLGQSDFTSKKAAVTQSGLDGPWSTAFDSTGNLWVADLYGHRVLRYSAPFASGMSADLVLGQMIFTTSTGGTGQNKLDKPTGMAFDSAGNLWVAEDNNNRVVRFTPPFANGMNASLVVGQSSFTTNVAATTQNGLHAPYGIAFDSVGNLWVADGGNSRVLRFPPPFSSGMSADLVIGQSGFTSKMCATTQNGLCGANGLAFDPRGNLWVVDNNRALRFSPPFSSGMNANLVLGQTSFSSSTTANTQSGLSNYVGAIAFDSAGNSWILDSYNDRALQYQCGAECPSTTISFSYSVRGGGTGYSAPVLTYMSGGRQQSGALSGASTNYNIDYGSVWSITGTLAGSSSNERWKTGQATTGIVTASQLVSLVYYHQYILTMQATPPQGGTVSPGSSWHNASASISISATPNAGWQFTGWTGTGTGSYTGSNSVATVTSNGPITEMATFAPATTSSTSASSTTSASQTSSTITSSTTTTTTPIPEFPNTGLVLALSAFLVAVVFVVIRRSKSHIDLRVHVDSRRSLVVS